MPATKKEDIELFKEIWTGKDKFNSPTKFIILTDKEKENSWKYFDVVSRRIHSWRNVQEKS